MEYEIKITNASASIKTQKTRTLYDAEGNAVVMNDGPPHRASVGIGDIAADPANPTETELAAFRTRVDEICGARLGKTLSQALADATASQDQIAAAKAEVKQAREDAKQKVKAAK